MTPQHDFTARRALARHCPELLPAAPGTGQLLADFSEAGFNLARELHPALSSLLGGAELSITCGAAQTATLDALTCPNDLQAVHSVLVLQPTGGVMLASVSLHAALALTDRVFGGGGEVSDPLPAALPRSAELALRQLEAALCHALGRITAAEMPPVTDRRGNNLAKLDPFSGAVDLAQLNLTIIQADQPGWDIQCSIALTDLERLLKTGTGPAKRGPGGGNHDPAAEPFGALPLPVEAVLAEMRLPLSRLSQLAPGDVFAIRMAGEIPLRIGGITIGFGTVGAVDGRVAIQLTRAMWPAAPDLSKEIF